MKLMFALYDPGAPMKGGSHWTWHAPSLSAATLDQLFYDFANGERPQRPNSLASDQVWGGAARLDDRWLAVYRFADGGRDSQGRPGRYVLMAALLNAAEAKGRDLAPLLCLAEFEQVVRLVPQHCPVPPPCELEIDLDLSLIAPEMRTPWSTVGSPQRCGHFW